MSAVGEFVVEHLELYGSSVGAIRGTVRDATLKFPGLDHDQLTALASELWNTSVDGSRLAAIVLLQGRAAELVVTDLTRLEGFVRTARSEALVRLLATEVIHPLMAGLSGTDRSKADTILARWAAEDASLLRLAAGL